MDYDDWRDMQKDIHGESPTPKRSPLSTSQFGSAPQKTRAQIDAERDRAVVATVRSRLGSKAYGQVVRGETWPVNVGMGEVAAIRRHQGRTSTGNPYRPGQRKDIVHGPK